MKSSLGKFLKIIPNPLSEKGNYSDLLKKTEITFETFNVFRSAISLVIFYVLVIYFSKYYRLPDTVIAVLLVYGFAGLLLSQVVRFWKLSTLRELSTKEQSHSFWELHLIDIKFLSINDIASFLLTCGFILIFGAEFSEVLETPLKTNPLFQSINLRVLLVGIIVLRLVGLTLKLMEYFMLKRIPTQVNIAQVNQSISLVKKRVDLLKFVPFMSALIYILYFLGLPGNIVLGMTGFTLVFVFIGILEIYRLSRVNLTELNSPGVGLSIQIAEEEKIIYSLFGVMNLNRTGFAVLGVGKTNHPENSMLITDKRILFIETPSPGAGAIVDEITYNNMNFFWNRGEIVKNGKELLEKYNLREITAKYGVKSIQYQEIAKMELYKTKITIYTNSNEKLSYLFMNKEYIEPLAGHLSSLLGTKFTKTH